MSKRHLVYAASALFSLGISHPAWAEIGRIKSFVGDVQISRDGRTFAARSGVRLEEGDVVSTGRNARVGISFLDNTRMALGPSSQVTLDEFSYNRSRQTGSFVTSVNRGSLGVVSGNIANSQRDAMRVRTPTSMLGVRGTRFIVEVD